MSYRFKEPGAVGGPSKFDDPVDKPGGVDDPGHRSFGRGRRSPGRDRPRDYFGRDEMPMRDRSPIRGGFDERFHDRYKRDENPYPKRDEMREKGGRPYVDDPYRDRYMGPSEPRGRYESRESNSRFDPQDERHRPLNYPTAPYKGYYKTDMMKPNECEIIVVSKHQRSYAENVEARMKNVGILVDILFLKDEALLVQTIDDIARRGSLYAMVISPLNETHRSVTLNILYGTPQEHRNMPLDDALKLVSRNFHDHIRNQREIMDRDRQDRGIYSGAFPADREIQFLLRILLDGRQLSIAELDSLIRFLKERREKMAGPEPVSAASASLETKPAPKDDIDIAKKEQDLQNRILNIMNQGVASDEAPNNVTSGDLGPANKPVLSNIGSDNSSMAVNQNMGSMMNPIGVNRAGLGGTNPIGMQNTQQPNQSPLGMLQNQSAGNANIGSLPKTSDANQQPSTQASTYINFDNPSVQKALDSLIQSGPNILKNISLTSTNSPSPAMSNPPPKMSPSNMGGEPPRSGAGGDIGMGNIGPQRGGPGSDMAMGQQRGGPGGDLGMGNMGPPRGGGPGADMGMGNMGQPRGGGPGADMGMGNMGQPRVGGGPGGDMGMGNMGSQRGGPGGDMGPQRGGLGGDMGLHRGGPGGDMGLGNMGSSRGGPGGNMGPPHHGMVPGHRMMGAGGIGPHPGSFQGQTGMYGGGNMMGNRPPFMGGPMGSQGMGGGPRRY